MRDGGGGVVFRGGVTSEDVGSWNVMWTAVALDCCLLLRAEPELEAHCSRLLWPQATLNFSLVCRGPNRPKVQ